MPLLFSLYHFILNMTSMAFLPKMFVHDFAHKNYELIKVSSFNKTRFS